MKRRILSIDGGGIKGVFAAQFLAELEEQCGCPLWKYFDLIAGTSTGAIIAAGLGMDIPAKQILDFYLEKGPDIFKGFATTELGSFLQGIKGILGGRYPASRLKEALESVFGEHLLGECKTRVVIPSYNLTNRRPSIFKTPHLAEYIMDHKEKIVDVLLATTAAPTYFPAHTLGDRGDFIDGGVYANNPATIALIEGMGKCKWHPIDIHLLSIGSTTDTPSSVLKDLEGVNAAKILDIIFGAESMQNEMIPKILLFGDEDRYIRINTVLPNDACALDKASEEALRTLRSAALTEAKEHVHSIIEKFGFDPQNDYKPCF